MVITIDGTPKEIIEFLSTLHSDVDFKSEFSKAISEYWKDCLKGNPTEKKTINGNAADFVSVAQNQQCL